MPFAETSRLQSCLRAALVTLTALAVASCDDVAEPVSAAKPAPQAQGGRDHAKIQWLYAGGPMSPAQWLASREAEIDLPESDPEVAAINKVLGRAARNFGDEPRMIANRAVQLEGMLAASGIQESAPDLIEGFLPAVAGIGAKQGFGALCQQYFNLRQQGVPRDAALERLREARLLQPTDEAAHA